MYPLNTTCTYVLDGLQGEQNLEKVILTFEEFALLAADSSISKPTSKGSHDDSSDDCGGSFVGIATTGNSIKAVLANNEESVYDATLCERIAGGSPKLGPYTSQGPRIVIVFGSVDGNAAGKASSELAPPFGFRARVEFKTGTFNCEGAFNCA